MIVIGIDPDTVRVSWAAFEEGAYRSRGSVQRVAEGRVLEPYRLDIQWFFWWCVKRSAEVHVEDIFLGRDGKGKPLVTAYKALAGLQGELKFIADGVGLELHFVSCLDWRRSQLGFTRGTEALQAASHERAAELAGEPVECPHEADAVCIAAHAADCLPTRSYKRQRAMSKPSRPSASQARFGSLTA